MFPEIAKIFEAKTQPRYSHRVYSYKKKCIHCDFKNSWSIMKDVFYIAYCFVCCVLIGLIAIEIR